MQNHTTGRALAAVMLFCCALSAADENVEKTIRDLYASSQDAAREARTMEDVVRALSTFAPEWVGNMPAGETLTFADLLKEGQNGIAASPEKRPMPQMDFVYIRQTGWNVLAVYWSYRRSGTRLVGSLYRDTWVQTSKGWQRVRLEKFFPDRTLIDDGKPVILPPVQ
jgi:hypothetical protein